MTTCPFCTSSLPVNATTCPTCGASLVSPALEIGAVVGGKYRIERVLGQGGFGITYLALDTELDHRVAIKELFVDGSTRKASNVIPPIGLDFKQTKAKFLEEAQTVQRFNDAGIVRVYGVFEGNQTAYMVMEALSGATLTADVVANGAFPVATVLELARQLCASLETVHEADLLHRDIKPDNVFLSGDGCVVLIDFGSARGFAQGQVKRLTRLVTPGYAAPEQYASQAAFGTYTDVYGLAATLYYAVEGQMPPMATDLMLGARLEFRNAGQLQAGLEAGLKVKVDERPQTVRDLLDLLERSVAVAVVSSLRTRVQHVLGWWFEHDRFGRESPEFFFRDIRLVCINPVYVKVNGDSNVPNLILAVGVMTGLCAVFLRSGIFLVISGAITCAGLSLRISKTVPDKYRLSIRTDSGQKFLDDFENKRDAVQLGKIICARAGVPLDIMP